VAKVDKLCEPQIWRQTTDSQADNET